MARTKQTARQSTGGKAPQRQLTSTSAASVRAFFVSQQSAGRYASQGKRKIFINCENTFGQFSFRRSRTTVPFQPTVSIAKIANPGLSTAEKAGEEEIFMRLDFVSSSDGNLSNSSRPPIDVVFVLDKSGSMNCAFPEDVDRRSKMAVAVDCISKITEQLTDKDRVGLVVFDDTAITRLALKQMSSAHAKKLKTSLKSIRPGGGTELATGLDHGFSELRKAHRSDSTQRLQRVFFLTDMQSSQSDEDEVLAIASKQALCSNEREAPASLADGGHDCHATPPGSSNRKRKSPPGQSASPAKAKKASATVKAFPYPAYVSVVGIGVDLSVSTVEKISAIPGAKYTSVVSSSELFATVAEDFNYEVTPIALGISLTLSPGLALTKVSGSAELNSLPPLSQTASISAEFAVPVGEDGTTSGGLYLCKLSTVGQAAKNEGEHSMKVTWRDLEGTHHEMTLPISLPRGHLAAGERVSAGCDGGVRKAVALAEYVECLTSYMLDDSNAKPHTDDSDDDDDSTPPVSPRPPSGRSPGTVRGGTAARPPAVVGEERVGKETVEALVRLQAEGIAAVDEEGKLPPGTPAGLVSHWRAAARFRRLRAWLLEEMAACGDVTLHTRNQNVLQTVSQVLELEVSEIRKALSTLPAALRSPHLLPPPAGGAAGAAGGGAGAAGARGTGDVPRGFLCPITLSLMRDPVIAGDGHSYERAAIQKWLQQRGTSPATNLPLPHRHLVENHALSAAIQDFRDKNAAAAAAAAAAPPAGVGEVGEVAGGAAAGMAAAGAEGGVGVVGEEGGKATWRLCCVS